MARDPAIDLEYLDEMGAKVEINGSTDESGARPILDSGRHGLEFFESFGPSYAAHTNTEFDFEQDIVRRYDSHGDMSFSALRRDGERFSAIQSGLEDTAINLRNKGSAVFEAWQGGAADSARSQFGTMLSAAEDLRGQFGRMSELVDAVAGTADRATYEKAAAVRELYTDRIGGCSAQDVAFLVGFAQKAKAGSVTEDELERAAELCGLHIAPAVCLANPGILAEVGSSVDSWLSGAFAPAYEARLRMFDAACTATEETLNAAWQGLSGELDTMRADQFDAVLPTSPQNVTPDPVVTVAGDSSATTVASAEENSPDLGGGDGSPAPGSFTGAVDSMQPSAAAPVAPAAPTMPSGVAGGGGQAGQGFLGGVPFAPPAAGGGGDQQRQSLHLPSTESAFGDIEVPEESEVSAIGAAGDTAQYNETAAEEAEVTEAAKPDKVVGDLFDELSDDFDQERW